LTMTKRASPKLNRNRKKGSDDIELNENDKRMKP